MQKYDYNTLYYETIESFTNNFNDDGKFGMYARGA